MFKFGMEKWTKPQKRDENSDPTNVVDIHKSEAVVDPTTGTVIGAAETQAEAVKKFRQAQIDAREAA